MVCVPDMSNSILTLAEDIRRSIKQSELVEATGLKREKSNRDVYSMWIRLIRNFVGAPECQDMVI